MIRAFLCSPENHTKIAPVSQVNVPKFTVLDEVIAWANTVPETNDGLRRHVSLFRVDLEHQKAFQIRKMGNSEPGKMKARYV